MLKTLSNHAQKTKGYTPSLVFEFCIVFDLSAFCRYCFSQTNSNKLKQTQQNPNYT